MGGLGPGAGLGNKLTVNNPVPIIPSRPDTVPESGLLGSRRDLENQSRKSQEKSKRRKNSNLTAGSNRTGNSQANLTERSDIKTSSSESEPAAGYDWKGFQWQKKKNRGPLKMNREKVKHYQENYQMELSDCENFREKYWNFKSKLCEDLQEISQYHNVFKVQDDKIVTWRTKQQDENSPRCISFYSLQKNSKIFRPSKQSSSITRTGTGRYGIC